MESSTKLYFIGVASIYSICVGKPVKSVILSQYFALP
jgi:hypothetical protein